MYILFFGAGPNDFPATDIADIFISLSIVSQISSEAPSKIGVVVETFSSSNTQTRCRGSQLIQF